MTSQSMFAASSNNTSNDFLQALSSITDDRSFDTFVRNFNILHFAA